MANCDQVWAIIRAFFGLHILQATVTVNRCCFLTHSYTKPKGQLPDYTAPVVLKAGHNTVEDFCDKLHRSIIKEFK